MLEGWGKGILRRYSLQGGKADGKKSSNLNNFMKRLIRRRGNGKEYYETTYLYMREEEREGGRGREREGEREIGWR